MTSPLRLLDLALSELVSNPAQRDLIRDYVDISGVRCLASARAAVLAYLWHCPLTNLRVEQELQALGLALEYTGEDLSAWEGRYLGLRRRELERRVDREARHLEGA
jgi:hypothetical protein